jgi:hypothetical protein
LRKGTILEINKVLQKPAKILSKENLEHIRGIEALVLGYQEEKTDAAIMELLHHFHPLLTKYANIMKRGKIEWGDTGTKTFLYSFFGTQGETNAERQWTYQDKLRTMTLIFSQVYYEDVYAELQCILIGMISRYRPMDRTFCAYVANSFPFYASRYARSFTSVQSVWHPRCDSYEEIMTEEFVDNNFLDEFEYFAIEDNKVDEFGYLTDAWVNSTEHEILSGLDPEQRRLLKLYYQDHHTDSTISEILNCHINTANQKRRKGVRKISEKLGVEPVRNRNVDKKPVSKAIKVDPKGQKENLPITIEHKIDASACKDCFHVSVCKYYEWYSKRIEVFSKSQLLADVDDKIFTTSFKCRKHCEQVS